jgi:hypothetical protein
MKKFLPLFALLLFGALVAGCGAAPALVSEKYLNDRTFVSQEPCGPPCFQDIIVGETTFADALNKVRTNGIFTNVQSQDNPPQAAWATALGEACCQMTADPTTGVVDAILLRLAPVMTVGEVIEAYGEPQYVSVLREDYSAEETAIGLVYPTTGNVVWVMPGPATANLDENDPVVVLLYLNPTSFETLIATGELKAWEGYKPVADYKGAPLVVTPRVTVTPAQ